MPPDPRDVVEQRTREAINLPVERVGVEFKCNADFETLKFKIAKTSMAMANLRDGGMIIVGVAQDNQDQKRFIVEGVDPANERTFVQEPASAFVNYYASPPVELTVVPLEHQGKRFIVIDIPPFERTPVVSKNNTPDGTRGRNQIARGEFYIRTRSPIGTAPVQSDSDMHELLEIAVQRRLAELERMLRGAGLTLTQAHGTAPTDIARDAFDAENEDLGNG